MKQKLTTQLFERFMECGLDEKTAKSIVLSVSFAFDDESDIPVTLITTKRDFVAIAIPIEKIVELK